MKANLLVYTYHIAVGNATKEKAEEIVKTFAAAQKVNHDKEIEDFAKIGITVFFRAIYFPTTTGDSRVTVQHFSLGN